MDSPRSQQPPARLTLLNPEDLGAPSGYSHGVLVPANSALLFVAGQIGSGSDGRIVADDFATQFRQALRNLARVIDDAGGQVSHIARLTIYVTDKREYLSDLQRVGRYYREVMGKHFPAMALLEVKGLVEPTAKVEIEATAAIL